MGKYILKRLGSVIVTLFILSIILFVITHMIDGDPARMLLGTEATEEQIQALREQMGLNDPILVQYFNWVADVLHGDLGDSYFRNESVVSAIKSCISCSLSLAVWAQLLALVIAVPGGIMAAKYRAKIQDGAISVFALLALSIPSFVLALILILVFGAKLKILPVAGYKTIEDGVWMHFKYLILPSVALGLRQAALSLRMTRSSVSEVLNTDYIKTAKAKGLSQRVILYKHAFRNALNTVLTVIGQSFGGLIAGAAVIETTFNIPGMGQLLVNSITKRDYPIVQGVVLVISLIYVLINFIVDLLYGVVDPRVRITGSKSK